MECWQIRFIWGIENSILYTCGCGELCRTHDNWYQIDKIGISTSFETALLATTPAAPGCLHRKEASLCLFADCGVLGNQIHVEIRCIDASQTHTHKSNLFILSGGPFWTIMSIYTFHWNWHIPSVSQCMTRLQMNDVMSRNHPRPRARRWETEPLHGADPSPRLA